MQRVCETTLRDSCLALGIFAERSHRCIYAIRQADDGASGWNERSAVRQIRDKTNRLHHHSLTTAIRPGKDDDAVAICRHVNVVANEFPFDEGFVEWVPRAGDFERVVVAQGRPTHVVIDGNVREC